MSRLDFDIRMLKLPPLPRRSIEGFLRYRSRSLYPGNPEETAFAYSLVRSGGAQYAVLFLCKRSIADGYLKLAAGSPLYLPFHFYRPFFGEKPNRTTVYTSWLVDCIDLLILGPETAVRAAAIRRSGSFEKDWDTLSNSIPGDLGQPRWVALCAEPDREAIRKKLAPLAPGCVRIAPFSEIRSGPSRRESLFAPPRDPLGIIPHASLPILGLLILVLASLVLKKGIDREERYARELHTALAEREQAAARLTALQNDIVSMEQSLARLQDRRPVQPYEVLSDLGSLLGPDTSIKSFILSNGSFQLEAVGSDPLDKMERFRGEPRFTSVRLLQIVPVKDSELNAFRMTGKVHAE